MAGEILEDTLNVFIQVPSNLQAPISLKSQRSFNVNPNFFGFQDLLWEKMFKNKEGQPMTVIRSKVRWSRITTPMMAVISNRRLVIIIIGFKRFIQHGG